tara:strand:- start:4359 stop:4679 length:321 start_codon:yes stop_codon:yes gene_type:complete
MEKLFAYGTLKEKDIQENIFGRILNGVTETLMGYVVKEIQIEEEFGMETYPIIAPTQNNDDTIEGIVYDLTEKEIQLADTYEGGHYKRVEVQLQSKEIAWAYSAKV